MDPSEVIATVAKHALEAQVGDDERATRRVAPVTAPPDRAR
jgi:hypothetical protein